MDGYRIILADPPWDYDNKRNNDPRMGGITYPTMSNDAIAALPVGAIAAKDCALFLWATMPKLPEALMVMQSWGFRYTTTAFVWVKLNPTGSLERQERDLVLHKGIYSGMGSWTCSNVEVVLFGKRGTPKRITKSVKQVLIAPVGRHSAKPPEINLRIKQLMGTEDPAVELFARVQHPGWTAVGHAFGHDIATWLNANRVLRRAA